MTKSALKTLYSSLQTFTLMLAASLSGVSQATADDLAGFKAAKPYTLEIRYGSLNGNTGHSTLEVTPEFLDQAESLLVGTAVPETGFAASGPLTFAFKLMPHQNPSLYVLEYIGSLRKTEGQVTLKSTLQIQPDEWTLLGSTQDTFVQNGQPVNRSLLIALRLSQSVP